MRYYVYILLCKDGTFYTGSTKNVDARAKLHATGRGARYTKNHPPKKVAYVETFPLRSEAMRRERAIKKLSHQQKSDLANSFKQEQKQFANFQHSRAITFGNSAFASFLILSCCDVQASKNPPIKPKGKSINLNLEEKLDKLNFLSACNRLLKRGECE